MRQEIPVSWKLPWCFPICRHIKRDRRLQIEISSTSWNLAELYRRVCKLEFGRDVLTHPGPCSSFFFSAWWIRRGRVDGNSSPRRKFPFSVPFIPHSFYLLLSFYLPQKRKFKNTKNDKLLRRGKNADLKKLSKLRIRNREVIFMRCKKLSKFEESRL